ncbi:MAG: hypothetical protein IPK14_06825 [Blastocatellia bacterium]|nr:hypothetical protein [Blastocatellia bacterium]MBL8194461.1 hypothetical protein [Blastocatellia bacterium]MBN8722850.1 hypothetical protein [Acidobacteriota bacterium]
MGMIVWLVGFAIISIVFWLLVYDYRQKKARSEKEYSKDLEIQGIRPRVFRRRRRLRKK